MRLASGHLPVNEKVLAGKVAVCLPICVAKRIIDAIRAHQGHIDPQNLRPVAPSSVIAHAGCHARREPNVGVASSAVVQCRTIASGRHEASLSGQHGDHPQLSRRLASSQRPHSANFYSAKRPGCVPPYPAIQHSWRVRESSSAPRRKSQNSLTILTRNH